MGSDRFIDVSFTGYLRWLSSLLLTGLVVAVSIYLPEGAASGAPIVRVGTAVAYAPVGPVNPMPHTKFHISGDVTPRIARIVAEEAAAIPDLQQVDWSFDDVTEIRFVVRHFAPAEKMTIVKGDPNWYGATYVPNDATKPRIIYVDDNSDSPQQRDAVFAHEFGHALGLSHHTGPGVTGWRPDGDPIVMSDAEVTALRAAYAHP